MTISPLDWIPKLLQPAARQKVKSAMPADKAPSTLASVAKAVFIRRHCGSYFNSIQVQRWIDGL
nr:hypothetical protein [uncultured Ottowia sp.]